MRKEPAPPEAADALIAEIAAGQYGIVTARQLVAAGLSPAAVRRRVVARRLHRIHQGVYAVGHPGVSREGRWLAATLACGQAAVLSHRSAAELWELLTPADGLIHVTVPGRNGRMRRTGVRIHRPVHFDDSLVTRVRGIPVTTVQRTLVDLRRAVAPATLRRARRNAGVRDLLADGVGEPDRTRSDLERAFLRICERHRLPAPEVNVRIGRFTVDFLWREHGLVIEVDGYAYHRGRQAFRDDRDRDLELGGLGLTVHRIADSRIGEDPAGVGQMTRQLLEISARRTRRGGK